MELAFEEVSFEWEFLHPKGSIAVHQPDLELNCFAAWHQASEQGEELDNEPMSEEICQEPLHLFEKEMAMDEVVAAEEDTSFVSEEDDFDWGLRSLLFKEGEEEMGEMVQLNDTEIYVKNGCKAFGLKTWLKSALTAAALSIFILGGGIMQFTGNNKRSHAADNKNEGVKVQHKQTVSSSLSGHCDERF